jgi:RES domain-containing protein
MNLLHFDAFMNILKHESRFIVQEPYRSLTESVVAKVKEQLTVIIPANTNLYRARINATSFENREKERIPFPIEEMGPPPAYLAKPGRINPEGIPYLYCAGDEDTAGAELRPWKGANLTIAHIEIAKDIPVADLTVEPKDKVWDLFFDELSRSFSTQWPPELKLNYLVTQYFSEHFKVAGLRGVKYRSEFNSGGDNYALFFGEDYTVVKTHTVEAIDVSFCFYAR